MATCEKCGTALEPDEMCTGCLLEAGLGMEAEPSQSLENDALENDTFGPYRILRLLGEGGMGAVYLAEQTRPIRRQVALKVVKFGLDSSQILSRFNYERQALALMDHSNIAQVYDAGASVKGRPYFVMEFVDGLPITQYCDRHRLNTRERLELFLPVCQALQHAHQKGVIHRDIKPSNVMVIEKDGRPIPKVIDFGIAKATDQRAVENTTFTNLGQFIGTPEYMSPEQADALSGDVDTRSDVYSLGALLYELLIGAVPFDTHVLRKAGLSELLRIIREEEAISMTAKLTAMGKSAIEAARCRRTDPITLRRQVAGDLNWIVMKAIEKERPRRYAAVSELAADIRRHLDDHPVSASPPSTMYRARKFVRRHRLPFTAATAVLLALVAGIAIASWQAVVARRERSEAIAARGLAEQRSREAAIERNRAEEQTAIAVRQEEVAERQEAVAEARLDDVHTLANSMLFEINDDVKDLVGGTKARETLVRLGQQYLNKEAAVTQADPRRRRELAEAFIQVAELQGGAGQSSLRDIAGAIQSFARSIAILEREVQASPRDPHLRHLLTVAYARQARLEESSASRAAGYDRALKSAEVFAARWPRDPQGLRDTAEVLEFLKPDQAVEIRQRVLAGDPKDLTLRWELARSEGKLGFALGYDRSQESLDWLQKACDIFQALSREEPGNAQYQRDVAVTFTNMVIRLRALNRYDEAEALARQSVSILDRLTAADRRNGNFAGVLSDARKWLAAVLVDKGQTAEAIESLSEAVAIREKEAERSPDSPELLRRVAEVYRQLAFYKNKQADMPGSLDVYRKAEAIDRKLVGHYPGKFEFLDALRLDVQGIGAAYSGLGDNQSALRQYQEAVATAQTAAVPPTPASLAALKDAHHSLALQLGAMSRWNEAVAEQRAAIEVDEQSLAANRANRSLERSLFRSYRDLANFHDSRDDYQSGLAANQKALPFLESDYAAHPDDQAAIKELLDVLNKIRVEYVSTGDYDRAIAAARRRVAIAEHAASAHPAEYASTSRLSGSLYHLGLTLRGSGRRDESLSNLRKAVSVLDQHPIERESSPALRRDMAELALSIADDLIELRRPEEGASVCKRLTPVLEALAHNDRGNDLFRSTLVRLYRISSSAFLGLGDIASARDCKQKELQSEAAPRWPRNLLDRAGKLAVLGSLDLRLGRREDALTAWRGALDMFERAAHDSEKLWTTDKNRSALQTHGMSVARASFMAELLGDLPQALRLRESVYGLTVRLIQSDGATPANLETNRNCQANVVRTIWLLDRDHGDYRPFFGNGDPAREELSGAFALAWRNLVSVLKLFACPIPQRMEAATTALDRDRQLLAANPTFGRRVSLAWSLRAIGEVYEDMAHFAVGAERITAYEHARESYLEARGILNSLKESTKLPDSARSDLITLALNLAAVEERLRE